MTVEIRSIRSEELLRFLEVVGTAFGNPIGETEAPNYRREASARADLRGIRQRRHGLGRRGIPL